jgi:hypothetical protein
MHRVGPDLVFSATDLASYAGCAQRTWLDRLKALEMAHWATTDVCVSSPFSRLGSAGNVSERPPARS